MITKIDIRIQRKVTRISNLIIAHQNNALSDSGKSELMKWVNASEHNKQCFEKWCNPEYMQKAFEEFQSVDSKKIFEKTTKLINAIEKS